MAAKFTDAEFIKIDVDELSVIFTFIFSLFLHSLQLILLLSVNDNSQKKKKLWFYGNRMWRRSLTWKRCRLLCCGRKGRKLTGLWAPRRTNTRTRLRNIINCENVESTHAMLVIFNFSYSNYVCVMVINLWNLNSLGCFFAKMMSVSIIYVVYLKETTVPHFSMCVFCVYIWLLISRMNNMVVSANDWLRLCNCTIAALIRCLGPAWLMYN